MNVKDIGTQLLFTTIPLWVIKEDESKVTGTGFIYSVKSKKEENSSLPFIVTNYHVIENAKHIYLELRENKDGLPDSESKLNIEIPLGNFMKFTDKENDLALIPFAPILNNFIEKGKNVFYRELNPEIIPEASVINDLSALEEVIFIGYPRGIYDHKNLVPLVRKGVTSSPIWNDFKGERCFLIDAGVYEGSSGSPVFIYNQSSYTTPNSINMGSRLLFVGILKETIVGTTDDVYLGLGKVIKSNVLKELVERIALELDN